MKGWKVALFLPTFRPLGFRRRCRAFGDALFILYFTFGFILRPSDYPLERHSPYEAPARAMA